jgi:hypothetical protein
LNIEDINPITIAITAPTLKVRANLESVGLFENDAPIKNKITPIITVNSTICMNLIN